MTRSDAAGIRSIKSCATDPMRIREVLENLGVCSEAPRSAGARRPSQGKMFESDPEADGIDPPTFEVLNGQRDSWQNLLVIAWLQSLSELRVAEMSKRAGIRAGAFCRRPVKKAMTGGSDDHMALFVGTTGSRVHVPNLARRLEREPPSALVLEALKRGSVAPYGAYTGEEKLAASFLDYFCQIARNAEDPGLVRLLLHQGTARQRIWAFLIANGMYELRRHRYTSKLIEAAHEALHGKPIGVMRRYAFSKEYRPLAKQLDRIAKARDDEPGRFEEELRTALPALFHELSVILARRVEGKVKRFKKRTSSRTASAATP